MLLTKITSCRLSLVEWSLGTETRGLKISRKTKLCLALEPGQREQECENVTPPCQFESAPHRLMCLSTSFHHPPRHLPPLKQLSCFGPALKAVLITDTERRSEWQAGSILLKPNERNLCRVCGLQRPEEAVPLPIVLLLLSS